jgi:hypothetical protein
MFDNTSKRTFLFRCEDCGMIVSIILEEEIDLEDVQEDKIVLECPCEGRCKVLRD